jgi:transposase
MHNLLDAVLGALDPYRAQLRGVVVESTYNWYWLVDGLMDAGYRVHLANTSAIQQYEGIKHTDDESDAVWLARMLRLGILPQGYIYPREKRAVRDLLRKRSQLVRQRTANILSVENLLARDLGISRRCAEVKRLRDEEVEVLVGDANRAMAIKSTLAVMRSVDAQIKKLEDEVCRQVEPDERFQLLSLVSGIGDILAMTIVLETGDITRFRGVGNYASYCRKVKSARESNAKSKGANNRKNGNVYLAWAYGEAAMHAIMNNPVIKTYYERKRAKTDTPRAMNAVGHKLARAFYHVMRTGKVFDTERAFGKKRG